METKPGDRKQATRQRRKEAGLIQLELWVLPDDVEKAKKLQERAVRAMEKQARGK